MYAIRSYYGLATPGFVGEAVKAPQVGRSGSPVDILEAHDVVLSQVGAGLHLDQLQSYNFV